MGGRQGKAWSAARRLDPEEIPAEGIAALAQVVSIDDELTVLLVFRRNAGLVLCDAVLAGRRAPEPGVAAALRERAVGRFLIADVWRERGEGPTALLYLATDAKELLTAECLNARGPAAAADRRDAVRPRRPTAAAAWPDVRGLGPLRI